MMMRHPGSFAFTFADTASVIARIYLLSMIAISIKTESNGYTILPVIARYSRVKPGTQWHYKAKRKLPNTSVSSSFDAKTVLLAARNYECAQNATIISTDSSNAYENKAAKGGVDNDEEQFLRFMHDALEELEAFRMSKEEGYLHSENSNFESNKELSLLFPREISPSKTRIGTDINDLKNLDAVENVAAESKGSCYGSESLDVEKKVNAEEDGVWRARWLLIAAAALYGTNFSVVKLLGDEMPVGISTSLRFGLAALATLPWLVDGFVPKLRKTEVTVNDKELNSRRVMATMYGLEVGLWNSFGYMAQAVGLETTLASESAFLCSMAVVIVPLLDWLSGKKLLSRQWIGAFMALVGVAFLELGGINLAQLSSAGSGDENFMSTGDALSLVQPVAFGLGFWRMEQAMHRFPREAPRMTAAQLVAVFLISIGYNAWTLDAFHLPGDMTIGLESFSGMIAAISAQFPWREWLTNPYILFSIFWTGCITTALTIYMENMALESLSAAETTLIFSTEPLWGTAFAVAVMGEQMGMNAVVGAGLILTACIYSNLGLDGLQALWMNLARKKFGNDLRSNRQAIKMESSSSLHSALRNHWPWFPSTLSGCLATWNIATDSDRNTQELDDIVDTIFENIADKL